ncbi:MAG: hypothetical protein ACRYGG_14410, partial [Janthinobacterium lividum]
MNYNILMDHVLNAENIVDLFVNYYGSKFNTNNVSIVNHLLSPGYPFVLKNNGHLFICIDPNIVARDLKNSINLELITKDTPLKLTNEVDVKQ